MGQVGREIHIIKDFVGDSFSFHVGHTISHQIGDGDAKGVVISQQGCRNIDLPGGGDKGGQGPSVQGDGGRMIYFLQAEAVLGGVSGGPGK